jgi:DNA-directed RNA polymerase
VASEEGNMILPKRKNGEGFEEFQKRQKQAQVFYETSYEVMQGLLTLGNEFWITNKYDRRGRTYSIGYHINPQGTDYNKAVLELSRKEVITG